MKLPLTLSFYIIRQFLWSFLIVFSVFSVLILLIDGVELIRKASGKDVPIYILVEMVFLKFPLLIQTILPFIILVSSVLAYTSMARRQELVIIRSAGVSAWEFLIPSIFSAFMIGVFTITIFNPIACSMLSRFELLEARHFFNKKNLLEISDQGLWIKQEINIEQPEDDLEVAKNIIIHANEISGEKKVNLTGVASFAFNSDDIFKYRVDATKATLEKGSWVFQDAVVTDSEGKRSEHETYIVLTQLEIGDIQKSFSDPQTISFWELPKFIKKLNKSGFSDLSHVIHYHNLLSSPFFYGVMVLIGALFSLKAPRQGGVGYSISFSIVLGFFIYFLSNLISSIGLSGSLPVILAAWTPLIITGSLGILLLLHFEDG